jgi:hypothetical protein
MEKYISRREFLKSGLTGVTGLALASPILSLLASGCKNSNPDINLNVYDNFYNIAKDEEIKSLEREYQGINPDNLTPQQQTCLEAYHQLEKEGEISLTKKEKAEIRAEYPFINPDNLTTRDKVFLISELEKMFDAMALFSF